MKKVFLSLAIAAIVFSASGQDGKSAAKPLKFGIGITAGLPVGDLNEVSSFTYGIDVQAEYAVAETVGITLSAGYLGFTGKNGFKVDGGLVPVLAGARFYIAEKIFASAQAGISFSTTSGGGSAFTYAPGLGYKASDNVDLTLKYQAATKSGYTTSFIGLRAGFNF